MNVTLPGGGLPHFTLKAPRQLVSNIERLFPLRGIGMEPRVTILTTKQIAVHFVILASLSKNWKLQSRLPIATPKDQPHIVFLS